jgi:uncharacterized damage-inducible protein DinB
MTTDALRFPTGKFQKPAEPLDAATRAKHIETIATTPKNLSAAVRALSEKQHDTPYRPEGWTVRQVVHHVADSHMNAYIRVKLAITEDQPPVKAYDENAWAKLADNDMPVDVSLKLLEALHERWVRVLKAMTPEDFTRTVVHTERGPISVDFLLALYAWHGPHHIGHVKSVSS